MIRDVVTADMTREDWAALRPRLRARILQTLGEPPSAVAACEAQPGRTYAAHGLQHEELRFEVLPGLSCQGTLVYPAGTPDDRPGPGALCVHGTDPGRGRRNVLDPEAKPRTAYGIELARRGYVTLAVDQYGFGDWLAGGRSQSDLYAEFAARYPDWSLDGLRLFTHQRALDILCRHPHVDAARVAAIGNSLGGRAVMYLAALDERVRAAVPSTGVSPNVTNVFRNAAEGVAQLSPRLNAAIRASGHTPWEYQELIALVAPRGLLLLEPFNDDCNPYVEPVVECFLRARRAWEVLGDPGRVALVCHGWGHGTGAEMRAYAYALLDLWLNG